MKVLYYKLLMPISRTRSLRAYLIDVYRRQSLKEQRVAAYSHNKLTSSLQARRRSRAPIKSCRNGPGGAGAACGSPGRENWPMASDLLETTRKASAKKMEGLRCAFADPPEHRCRQAPEKEYPLQVCQHCLSNGTATCGLSGGNTRTFSAFGNVSGNCPWSGSRLF